MKKAYSVFAVIACVFFIIPTYAQHTRVDSLVEIFLNHPERVMVTAHRSAHQYYPENSLGAVKEAIRLEVDIAEVDVRQTKDSVLVLLHDERVDRTTNGKGEVANYTYKQLLQLRLLQNGKPTSETIPTLEQALKAAKGKIMVDLDFKLDDESVLKHMYQVIEKSNCTKQVLVFLYDYKKMPALYKLNPQVKLMPRAYSANDVYNILALKTAHVIHIDESFYSDSLMQTIADDHVRIWSNSLGKYDDLQETSQSGFNLLLSQTKYVNIVQTNLPGEWLQYLKIKEHHKQ